MQLILSVISGPNKGKTKDFIEDFHGPDVLIVGRNKDCGCRLTEDPYLSRHHFIIDINPPEILLRDLGSRNGTKVNGRRYGGPVASESSIDAVSRNSEVDIKNGDILKAGKTELQVRIIITEECGKCGKKIRMDEFLDSRSSKGSFICKECRMQPDLLTPRKSCCVEVQPKESQPIPSQKEPSPEPPKQPEKIKKPVLIQGMDGLSRKVSLDEERKTGEDPGSVIDKIIRNMLQVEPGQKQENKYPVIAGYRILNELGKGGFGAVYLAEHEKTGKKVALKTMLETKNPSLRQRDMFEREIAVNTELNHPNIIAVRDYCVSNGIHYFALEYMDGGSLWDVMKKKGKLSPEEAAPIMLQSLEGLAFAHAKNIIHRDLKPPNILLSGEGKNLVVKVSDFGLAKNFAQAGMTRRAITVAGVGFCGSPPYMAPEHIKAYRYIKPPTDVFEIGATFYHMLTGEIIWDFSKGKEPLLVILEGEIKPIRDVNPHIPWKLADVIDHALILRSDDRYPDAGEMLKAMKKALGVS